jgi:tetratricopeptide (TPR) repeat protein
MKTQMTVTMTVVAALTIARPCFAQVYTPTAPPELRARAAIDRAASLAADHPERIAQVAQPGGAQLEQALAAAKIAATDATRIQEQVAEAMRAAAVIAGPDLRQTITAAREAATMWRDMDLGHTLAMSPAAIGWEPQSDRDREASRAQREKDDAAREAAREKERVQREREREYSLYDQGQSALDSGRWDRAVSSFDRVVELKGNKADAALYWKAYAQNKLGQRPEAMATINQLVKDYPKSRYLNDAKALEVEVKGGQANAATETDEDMKLMILNGLANSGSEDVVPMLQKLLQGTSSPRVKSRALFVLAQSNSAKAREVLVNIAKGGSNPDLQMKAVQYLGIHGGAESRAALADVYASSSDVDLKKRILNAFMVSGERDRLLRAAQSEQNPELRAAAVQFLGVSGAHDELWTLYQKESSVDVKKQIIRALFTGGSVTRLTELAKSEQNPELRLLAVRNLGMMGGKRTADTLVEIYSSDKDPEVKKAVINALFISNNGEGLVALARKEQDPAMKKEMVSKLSNMQRSKVVTDYLLEILNVK